MARKETQSNAGGGQVEIELLPGHLSLVIAAENIACMKYGCKASRV